MTNTAVEYGAAPAPQNVVARFIGILTSPRSVFTGVAAVPKVFGIFAITTVLVAFFTALPLTTEDGRQAAIDQQISSMQSFGVQVTPELESRLEQGAGRMPYTTAIGVLVISPIMLLIVSGIFFAVFNAALGGEASFKQVTAIVAHAGVISGVSAVFAGIINYFRGGMGSVTTIASLLPMIPEQSFVGHLMGAIDIFLLWYVLVLAMGLAVLYRRRTQPIAISLFAVYAVIAIGIAVFKSRAGGA